MSTSNIYEAYYAKATQVATLRALCAEAAEMARQGGNKDLAARLRAAADGETK